MSAAEQNDARAFRGNEAMVMYCRADGFDNDPGAIAAEVSDLIADLLHYVASVGDEETASDAMKRAYANFLHELADARQEERAA